MKLLLSTGCFYNLDASRIFKRMEGFDGLELLIPSAKWATDYSFRGKVESVHVPLFYRTPIRYSINPVGIARKNVLKGLEVARDMNVKRLVVHPLGCLLFKQMGQRRTARLLKKLKIKDIEFLVENLERYYLFSKVGVNLSCFRSMREWYEFGEEYDFNLCLDTTHCLSFNEDPIEVFELYKDRIKNIHLSDFKDGKLHMNLGEGVFDFKEFFRVLRKNKYEGNVVLELNLGMENLVQHNLEMIKMARKG